MITVAIIEDNRLVREGLADLLDSVDDVRVVHAAARVETSDLQRANPDVVLLDIGLEDANGLRVAEAMQVDLAEARVIVMDLLPAHEEIEEFVNAGVAGFILKDATFEDFIGTIRLVADGTRVLPPPMAGTLFSQIVKKAAGRSARQATAAVRMTPREQEVIALIANGRSNKAIAADLNMATHTVKSHVRNIMEKLALHSRLQIAVYAHRQDG